MNIYSVMIPRQSRINLGVEFKCPKQKQRRKVSNVPTWCRRLRRSRQAYRGVQHLSASGASLDRLVRANGLDMVTLPGKNWQPPYVKFDTT